MFRNKTILDGFVKSSQNSHCERSEAIYSERLIKNEIIFHFLISVWSDFLCKASRRDGKPGMFLIYGKDLMLQYELSPFEIGNAIDFLVDKSEIY